MKIFDLHVDLSSFCLTVGRSEIIKQKSIGNGEFPDQVDLPRLKKAGVKLMLANICPIVVKGSKFILPGDPLRETFRQLSFYYKVFQKTPGISLDGFPKLGNGISGVISIEGAYFIKKEDDLKYLPILKDLGVVSISPTWNFDNSLGSGAANENAKKGLTALGKKFVQACEEENIIVDAVHASRKTFFDIAKVAKKPFFVSHTASNEVFKHRRNLTKEQMKAVVKSGGIIGICFIKPFIGSDSMDGVIAHLKSMVDVAGIDHVSIGGDFDGMSKGDLIHGLEDISKIPDFLKACKKAGFSNADLEKIAFKNAYKFFNQNLQRNPVMLI